MNKGLSLLGLAFRSGNLVSGEFAAREAVRKKTAALIIVHGKVCKKRTFPHGDRVRRSVG